MQMERFGVIGLSWRQGGTEALARFTVDQTDAERLAALRAALDVDELVYVATCNRVELYFRTERPGEMGALRARAFAALTGTAPEPGEAERGLRAWAGEGAAEHLFLVAAGLDSAEVGETEIVGQLRRALDTALDLGLVAGRGSQLVELFETALKVARRVRRDAGLDRGRTSLAEVGLEALRARVTRAPGAVLLVGVSPMTERCAADLERSGAPLLIANRTRSRAEALARSLTPTGQARALDLTELRTTVPAVTAIATATAAPGHVLDRELLAALATACPHPGAPLLVDFATAPDADPAAAHELGYDLLDMPTILARAEATRARRLADAAGAREELDAELDRLKAQLDDARVAPLIAGVQNHYRAKAQEAATRLCAEHAVENATRDALLALVDGLARSMAHLPSTGLRGVARVAGPVAIDAFFARAEPALRALLDEANAETIDPAGNKANDAPNDQTTTNARRGRTA